MSTVERCHFSRDITWFSFLQLLLVARDFMSALIDTAANTGGILEKLAPSDSDENAKGI